MLTQSPGVKAPVVVANTVVFPERVPEDKALVPLPIIGLLAVKEPTPVPPR